MPVIPSPEHSVDKRTALDWEDSELIQELWVLVPIQEHYLVVTDNKDSALEDHFTELALLEDIPVTAEVIRVLVLLALGSGAFLLTLEVFTDNRLVSTVNSVNKILTVNTASTINRVFMVKAL